MKFQLRKCWVSNKALEDHITNVGLPDAARASHEGLMEKLPQLCEKQAVWLLDGARKQAQQSSGITLTAFVKILGWLRMHLAGMEDQCDTILSASSIKRRKLRAMETRRRVVDAILEASR